MADYRLNINGEARKVVAEPDTPLLWVLRDELGMTGTKYGCGIAQCGACTVHLDGVAVRACTLPVFALADQAITTIEGLANGVDLHPLQEEWIKQDVAQCGYCQAGQIMSAAALLATNSEPSDEDINQAMAGNYCRCGTYNRIRSAIVSAAATMRSSQIGDLYFDAAQTRESTS